MIGFSRYCGGWWFS